MKTNKVSFSATYKGETIKGSVLRGKSESSSDAIKRYLEKRINKKISLLKHNSTDSNGIVDSTGYIAVYNPVGMCYEVLETINVTYYI